MHLSASRGLDSAVVIIDGMTVLKFKTKHKARRPWMVAFHSLYPQPALSRLPLHLLKFIKSTPPENQCKQYLRWKMAEFSAVRATEQKANVTGKSFLILPSPATRKFSLTLLMPGRSLF